MNKPIDPSVYAQVPDANGRFGPYGGKFVSETLMSALAELERVYAQLKEDPDFQKEFDAYLAHFVGAPRLCTRPSAGLMRSVEHAFTLSVKI